MKRSSLRYRSKGKEGEWRKYVKERNAFIDENKVCQVKSQRCTKKTDCVHHQLGRGAYLRDRRFWMASCSYCNTFLETAEGKIYGIKKGFRLDRIGIKPPPQIDNE